ncbi:Flap endonuclease 1 [Hypsizygus marmoreus]|uniref:Flap endonuclease 1 n=1 Tax=Hypsizygus marmoreus TaxID=39966 RepID=A0A369IYJ1_HYPMA|nr:Flap endonuclease 1 [Hypsizygus marmoreus]
MGAIPPLLEVHSVRRVHRDDVLQAACMTITASNWILDSPASLHAVFIGNLIGLRISTKGRRNAQQGRRGVNESSYGFFCRTIRIVENGVKPAYMFDGKPPELKKGVLSKRFEKQAEAKEGGSEAKETGTDEEMGKFSRRTVKVSREHNEPQSLVSKMGAFRS